MMNSPVTNRIFFNPKLYILTVAFFASLSSSYAETNWDVMGNYTVQFTDDAQTYGLQINITNQDCATGVFTGVDAQGYQISGEVYGTNGFQFSDPQVGGFGGVFTGSIDDDGFISGTVAVNNGHGIFYGPFGFIEGLAVSFSAPMFVVQPSSVVTNAGQSVTFAALATGNPAPTYQWEFNGIAINNATNASYTIAEASTANLGLYSVVASNCPGTNVSTAASLSFLNIRCFPGLVLYGPPGQSYDIQTTPAIGDGTNFTTITNITLTSTQPYIYIDYSSITNVSMFYRAVPR
jgi:hypothetical protein